MRFHDVIEINGQTPLDITYKMASGLAQLFDFLVPIALKYAGKEQDPKFKNRPHPHDGHYVNAWLRNEMDVPPVEVIHLHLGIVFLQ